MSVFEMAPEALLTEADEAMLKTFFDVLEGEGWNVCIQDDDGCVVSWKQDPNNPIILVKGTIQINAPLRDVCDFMIDDNDRARCQEIMQTLDPMCKALRIVEAPDAKHTYKYATFNMPPPLWPRDFVWLELNSMRPDGSYVSIGQSVERADCPPVTTKWINEVRAEITVSGYWVQPIEGEPAGCRAHYLMQCDPKGMIPAPVVNLCCKDQGLNVRRLKAAVEGRKEAKEKL